MMKLILSATLILSLPTAFAEKKTADQYWTESGLTPEVLKSVITTKGCYKDALAFRGCVYALDTLLAGIEPSVKLVPVSLEGDASSNLGAAVKSFDKLSVVSALKIDASKETTRTMFKKGEVFRAKLDAAIKATFESSTPLVDFPGILAYALAEGLKDKAKEARQASSAINAYLREAVDPHSYIVPAAESEDRMQGASENFFGIGANLRELNGKVLIVSPMDGSPALKAGIRANDIILAVDGFETTGKSLEDVVAKIRGQENSTVVLHILRAGKEIDVSIVRGRINVENVSSRMLENSAGDKVAYIKLQNFSDRNACEKIEAKIKALESEGAKSLIFDLRQDPGGLLDQSNCIGGLFVGRKVIVKVKDLSSNSFQDYTSRQDQVTNLPMVVLIDAGSASASEIVAGALQDHNRAWIVGERSFGKGSVQQNGVFMRNPRIYIFRTIQRFYQPLGRTNQVVGILPNFDVPVKPDASEDERFQVRESDLYPNALEAKNAPWVETRPEEVAKIRTCMASTREAVDLYEKGLTEAMAPDYQLLYAEEVLRCAQ